MGSHPVSLVFHEGRPIRSSSCQETTKGINTIKRKGKGQVTKQHQTRDQHGGSSTHSPSSIGLVHQREDAWSGMGMSRTSPFFDSPTKNRVRRTPAPGSEAASDSAPGLRLSANPSRWTSIRTRQTPLPKEKDSALHYSGLRQLILGGRPATLQTTGTLQCLLYECSSSGLALDPLMDHQWKVLPHCCEQHAHLYLCD